MIYKFPKYINVGNTAMVFQSVYKNTATYFRPAGVWSLTLKFKYNVLMVCENPHGIKDTPTLITEKEFLKDNEGYI